MPTTYTNGLKLPDLGSIDWYNAYKNNIDILDPIVGTVNGVATTYAPISHSHSASEITSGTIDIARLPPAALERLTTVADQTARYALTTSTVQLGDTVKQLDTGIMYLVVDTTKLNSADGYVEYSAGTASKAIADEDGTSIKTGYGKLAGNQTWTGNNTFTQSIISNSGLWAKFTNLQAKDQSSLTSSQVKKIGVDSSDGKSFTKSEFIVASTYTRTAFCVNYYNTSGTIAYDFVINQDVDNQGNKSFYPNVSGTSKLGTSSYQWSSVYAQSYYYNGTEFQNKFVTADTDQTITGRKNFKTTYSDILPKTANFPSSTRYYVAQRDYAYNDETLTLTWGFVQTSGLNVRRWYVYPYSSGDSVYFQINVNADATESEFKTNVKSVIPVTNNATNLGTSTNKWKTLNGVNPGALSLPIRDYNSSIALDTTDWVYDGTSFTTSMTMPGWVVIVAENVDASDFIKIRTTSYTRSPGLDFVAVNIAGSYSIKACFPIDSIMCLCLKLTNGASSIKYARYYPCLGNV